MVQLNILTPTDKPDVFICKEVEYSSIAEAMTNAKPGDFILYDRDSEGYRRWAMVTDKDKQE